MTDILAAVIVLGAAGAVAYRVFAGPVRKSHKRRGKKDRYKTEGYAASVGGHYHLRSGDNRKLGIPKASVVIDDKGHPWNVKVNDAETVHPIRQHPNVGKRLDENF
jgi:hypothetical protein